MTTLALIGVGKWGKNYINTIRSLPSCKLPESFIKTNNYKELFPFSNINGVIIATPASTHFRIAKEFLEKGFNVLIEKPFTTSSSDAVELGKLSEKTGALIMVGHIYRYNPAFLKLNKLLPKIGKVQFIKSQGMNLGPFRKDVSALWDYAPHDISMITSILGNPISVSAKGLGKNCKSYDNYFFELKFSDNLFSTTTVGRISKIKKRILIVVGDKGKVVFDDLSRKKLTLEILGKKIEYPRISNQSPLENQVLEFADCINKNRKPRTDVEEGMLTVKILEAMDRSIKSGGKEVKIQN